MPSKPIPLPREELDRMREAMGRLPDNYIESATGGTSEGTPEPESTEAQVFLNAALGAVRAQSETPPSEAQGEDKEPHSEEPSQPSP
jgi:hypothetical protein